MPAIQILSVNGGSSSIDEARGEKGYLLELTTSETITKKDVTFISM